MRRICLMCALMMLLISCVAPQPNGTTVPPDDAAQSSDDEAEQSDDETQTTDEASEQPDDAVEQSDNEVEQPDDTVQSLEACVDGQTLAYFAMTGSGTQIHVAQLDGTSSINITHRIDLPSPAHEPVGILDFSNNGELLYFNATPLAAQGSAPRDAEIFSIIIDGGQLQQLTNNDVDDMNPSVVSGAAASGEEIVYEVSQRPQDSIIYIMGSDGTNQRPLGGNSEYGQSPDLSNDGLEIVFEGEDQLYVMDVNGSNRIPIPNTTDAGDPVWGKGSEPIIVYSYPARDPRRAIYRIRVDGSDQVQITQPTANQIDDVFDVLNGGEYIIFSRFDPDQGGSDLYLKSVFGNDPVVQLTHTSDVQENPPVILREDRCITDGQPQ